MSAAGGLARAGSKVLVALVLSSAVPILVLAFVLLVVVLPTLVQMLVVLAIAGALAGGWIIWDLGRVKEGQEGAAPLIPSFNKMLAIIEQQAAEINTFASRLDAAYQALESTHTRLREGTFKDDATELWNRRFLLLRLEEEIARWRRHDHPVSIVLLDLEGLRSVADTRGYAEYEEALAAFARILAEPARGIDVMARYDGSRFAALLVETPRQDALRFVDWAREVIVTRFPYATETVLKVGIASLPEDAALAEELLSVADTSLRRGT
jgi:diguanylate cyclase (GGDEF)-like protein